MKISIIIPIYNVEKYLDACLDSVIHQTHQDIEIILINDGSTDGSLQICEKYKNSDGRILLINKENNGLAEARNSGFQCITGEYVCFADSDDVLAFDYVKKLIETSLKFDADIVECDFIKFETDDELQELKAERSDSGEEEYKVEVYNKVEALKLLLTDELRSIVWNKLYNRKLIGPILFEKGKIHEDQFWTHQIFAQADKVVHLRTPLYYYRIHSESIMGREYHLERLHDIEAFDEQVLYMRKNFPSLTTTAMRRLFYNVLRHYNLLKSSNLKGEAAERKNIISILRKYNHKEFIADWGKKETFWFKFLVCYPAFCYSLMKILKDF